MNLEQFGEELAQARIAKGISLVDISAETRISMKFLEAMERGQFKILPQTYVRAFLKEYALQLNLAPQDILNQYNKALQEGQNQKSVEPSAVSISSPNQLFIESFKNKHFVLTPLQRNFVFGIFLFAVVVIVIVLANMNKDSGDSRPTAEIPFDRIVRESEAVSLSAPAVAADSMPVLAAPQKDSLRLEITTLDSVWISLLIDGTKGEEYLFPPNRKRAWMAKERFAITMGNAGGATFQLNGKDIGTLGKRGAVIRSSIITEANLKN